jgi:hypothetical protein
MLALPQMIYTESDTLSSQVMQQGCCGWGAC